MKFMNKGMTLMPLSNQLLAGSSITTRYKNYSALLLVIVGFCASQFVWAEAEVNQDVEARVTSILKNMTL
jgi:hypothetical protein